MFYNRVLLCCAAFVIVYVQFSSADKTGLHKFSGVEYKLHSRDDKFPEILVYLGASRDAIAKALKEKPVLSIKSNGEKYTLKRHKGGFGDFDYTFKTGEEFDTTFHICSMTMKFTEDGDTLTQEARCKQTGGTAKLVYTFSDTELKVVTTLNNVDTTEIFRK